MWTCLVCGNENDDEMIRCICGYEIPDNKADLNIEDKKAETTRTNGTKGSSITPAAPTETLKTIKNASIAFFIFAGVQLILGVLAPVPGKIIDGVLIAILTLILMTKQSRIAAILILAEFTGGVIIAAMNHFNKSLGKGSNIPFAILFFWFAFKAVKATFKFQRERSITTSRER